MTGRLRGGPGRGDSGGGGVGGRMGETKQGHKGEARSGEGDMGVPRKRESQRHPARASRPHVQGKGPKGYREEVAGHRARPAGRS